LAADHRIPLDRAALEALLASPLEFTGEAREQTARVINRIEAIAALHSGAAQYRPASIR